MRQSQLNCARYWIPLLISAGDAHLRYAQGVVSSIRGEVATVEVVVSDGGCGRCHETGGCASQNLSRSLCDRVKSIEVVNSLNASVGERVQIQLDEKSLRNLVTRLYFLPLLSILLGAGLGQGLTGDSSAGAVAGALAGLVLAFVWVALTRSAEIPVPTMISSAALGVGNRPSR